jgi:hypothetical protein
MERVPLNKQSLLVYQKRVARASICLPLRKDGRRLGRGLRQNGTLSMAKPPNTTNLSKTLAYQPAGIEAGGTKRNVKSIAVGALQKCGSQTAKDVSEIH